MRPILVLPFVALGLAACEATPPTITTDDIADFNESAEAALDLPQTPVTSLPGGTVTYTGQFGSDATVEGIDTFSMLGDMRMNVRFASQDVDGRIDNVNLIRDGAPQQLMGGSLAIDGSAINGNIDATAEGDLTREAAGKIEFASTELRLDGIVQTGLTPGDVVSGTVDGGGSGQFTFTLQDGTFYGTAEQ